MNLESKKGIGNIAKMDRRKYRRVAISNLISYLATDEDGKVLDQSVGKAVNISQSGLLLETTRVIATQFISLMSIDPDNNLIEIGGKVTYSRCIGSGKFGTGIHFQAPENENIQFAMDLVKVFSHRKNAVYAAV